MSWAIWITGLPGSGKTTVARGVARALGDRAVRVSVLALAAVARALISHFGEVQLLCPPDVCTTREREERWLNPGSEVATGPDLVVDYEVSLRPDLAIDTHAHGAWIVVDDVLRLAQRLQQVAAADSGTKERSHASA